MPPPRFVRGIVTDWLAAVATVLLVTAALVGSFLVGFHPAGLLSLLPTAVAEAACLGNFLCMPTLIFTGAASLGVGVAVLRWLIGRGYVTLPEAW